MFKAILMTYIICVFNSVIVCGRQQINEDLRLLERLPKSPIKEKSVVLSRRPILQKPYKKAAIFTPFNYKYNNSGHILDLRSLDIPKQLSTLKDKIDSYEPCIRSRIPPLIGKNPKCIAKEIELAATLFEMSSEEADAFRSVKAPTLTEKIQRVNAASHPFESPYDRVEIILLKSRNKMFPVMEVDEEISVEQFAELLEEEILKFLPGSIRPVRKRYVRRVV